MCVFCLLCFTILRPRWPIADELCQVEHALCLLRRGTLLVRAHPAVDAIGIQASREHHIVEAAPAHSADDGADDVDPEAVARPWQRYPLPAGQRGHQARPEVARGVPARLRDGRVQREIDAHHEADQQRRERLGQPHSLVLWVSHGENDEGEQEGAPRLNQQRRARVDDLVGGLLRHIVCGPVKPRVGEVLAERRRRLHRGGRPARDAIVALEDVAHPLEDAQVERTARDAAGELCRDVAGHLSRREVAPQRKGDGDGGIQVRAGDVRGGVDGQRHALKCITRQAVGWAALAHGQMDGWMARPDA
mmetsp:Transcript_15819/g.49188  ORF Transcript_15819/g.49188 Transcript_15819/m.49188 type:complete len:305 (-) Transcript_15819:575-1489(-)